jgi:pantoate--beta-alanine ligase
MRIVRTVAVMRVLAERWRLSGVPVVFVPTMGALHEGHVSLVRHARRLVGINGMVVVSIYVNPTQFSPNEDFKRYPRDPEGDARLCREAGVDLMFVPTDRQMYPSASGRPFSTFVVEDRLSTLMEGRSRPTHFRGVTTVVAKLFNIVDPDVAVFGAKDYQQAIVVKRLVRDLNFRVKIVVAPTLREPDGLAMSSRNRYLSLEERPQARVLWEAIQVARQRVRASRPGVPAEALRNELAAFVGRQPSARVDYINVFDPLSLEPAEVARRGTHLALAVFIGKTRLIDNARL